MASSLAAVHFVSVSCSGFMSSAGSAMPVPVHAHPKAKAKFRAKARASPKPRARTQPRSNRANRRCIPRNHWVMSRRVLPRRARDTRAELVVTNHVAKYMGGSSLDGTEVDIEWPIEEHMSKFLRDYRAVHAEYKELASHRASSPQVGFWRPIHFFGGQIIYDIYAFYAFYALAYHALFCGTFVLYMMYMLHNSP